jgi:hypothetical protein
MHAWQPIEAAVPPNWRQQILAILAGPGVTQPPHVPRTRVLLTLAARSLGLFVWFMGGILVLGIALGVLLPSTLASGLTNQLEGMAVVVALIMLRPRLFRFGAEHKRWQRTENPERALARAKRQPILYLRSFAFDEIASKKSRWLRFVPFGEETQGNWEQELVAALSRYAPVLSVGRPGEHTPPPGAALRFYVADERWKQTLAAIVPLCRLVVWTTGHTEGLQWEIAHLAQHDTPRQLLLWVHANVQAGTVAQRQGEWRRFTSAFRDAFPKPLPADARYARYIAFDDDWTPHTIPGAGYRLTPREWRLWARPSLWGLEPFLRARMPK